MPAVGSIAAAATRPPRVRVGGTCRRAPPCRRSRRRRRGGRGGGGRPQRLARPRPSHTSTHSRARPRTSTPPRPRTTTPPWALRPAPTGPQPCAAGIRTSTPTGPPQASDRNPTAPQPRAAGTRPQPHRTTTLRRRHTTATPPARTPRRSVTSGARCPPPHRLLHPRLRRQYQPPVAVHRDRLPTSARSPGSSARTTRPSVAHPAAYASCNPHAPASPPAAHHRPYQSSSPRSTARSNGSRSVLTAPANASDPAVGTGSSSARRLTFTPTPTTTPPSPRPPPESPGLPFLSPTVTSTSLGHFNAVSTPRPAPARSHGDPRQQRQPSPPLHRHPGIPRPKQHGEEQPGPSRSNPLPVQPPPRLGLLLGDENNPLPNPAPARAAPARATRSEFVDPVRCTTSTSRHKLPSRTSARRSAPTFSGGRSRSDHRPKSSRGVMQPTLGVGNTTLPNTQPPHYATDE